MPGVECDPAGLRSPAGRPRRLADGTPAGGADHDHRMSSAWGGADLDAGPQGAGHLAMRHLQVVCRRTGEAPDAELSAGADPP